MMDELVVGGVYVSPIVPAAVAALILTMLLSFLFARTGLYRLVWHRPIVEVSIFCMALALFALPAGRILT